MGDLVERLRAWAPNDPGPHEPFGLLHSAADRIEALEAALREAREWLTGTRQSCVEVAAPMAKQLALDAIEAALSATAPAAVDETRVKTLTDALQKIRSEQYKGRETVTPANAWPAVQRLNRKILGIYDIATRALEATDDRP